MISYAYEMVAFSAHVLLLRIMKHKTGAFPFLHLYFTFKRSRVRILDELQTKLAIVKERIGQHIRHPYLLQYIRKPVIDEDKLLLLLCIMDELLENKKLVNEEVEKYAITAMLVQIALDTHEHVSNETYTDQDAHLEKERQLTVLGGIYYSSLYYKFLAQMENIGLTRALAIGIKEINEHKIFVYQEKTANLDQLMTSIRKIEASLFEQLSDYFHLSTWKELASNILFVKRLHAERNQFIEKRSSALFENIKRCLFPKEKNSLRQLTADQQHFLIDVCDRYVNHSIVNIENSIKQLPSVNRLLENRILSIIEQYPVKGKIFVGEG